MHPSVFKALFYACYWPWVIYPMDKCALILKGGTNHSAILAGTVRVLCGYHRVYLYLYPVPYCAVSIQ